MFSICASGTFYVLVFFGGGAYSVGYGGGEYEVQEKEVSEYFAGARN